MKKTFISQSAGQNGEQKETRNLADQYLTLAISFCSKLFKLFSDVHELILVIAYIFR